MKRLLIVYNPRSSRYAEVEAGVLVPARELKGYVVGKYEVEKTSLEENVAKLAKILRDDDMVLAAGGDATGVIAANGILQSGCDATLAVLPYGNFNDLARTLGAKGFDDIFGEGNRKFYPLEVLIDGKHWRYAMCYVTVGMMAEATKLYNSAKMRKILRKGFGRYIRSYTNLAKWYFKNRKKGFLPEFKVNGELQKKRTSDYLAVNGRSMARVMKGGEDYLKSRTFKSKTGRLANFWRLCWLMGKSILWRVPGDETKGDVLEFVQPGKVEMQAEGESATLEGVQKIEIRKAEKYLRVVVRR